MFMRNEYVVLRKEVFGGIAFHKKTGTTIELDTEGQYLLGTLSQPKRIEDMTAEMVKIFQRTYSECEIEQFIRDLTERGFINKNVKKEGYPKDFVPIIHKRDCEAADLFGLSAPETVHLTLTKKCNLQCHLCYETKEDTPEMPKDAIFALIDKLSEMKVFQLAIGGGEPFLRADIFEIIKYCKKKGIVPNITTNGTLIDSHTVKRIKHVVGGVSVSLNGYSSKTNIGRDPSSFNDAVLGLKRLLAADIPTGVNVLVSNDSLSYLEDTFQFLKNLGVNWINVLRLKPRLRDRHFNHYMLSQDDLKILKNVLDCWTGLVNINVDTALTCLMYTIPIQQLRETAVYGCVAGIRFCTIDCDGAVYPCSFFKDSTYLVGNILSQDFQEMWQNSDTFKKFRKMRERLKGKCNDCKIKEYCGGCRSIALAYNKDFYGEDTSCIKNIGG